MCKIDKICNQNSTTILINIFIHCFGCTLGIWTLFMTQTLNYWDIIKKRSEGIYSQKKEKIKKERISWTKAISQKQIQLTSFSTHLKGELYQLSKIKMCQNYECTMKVIDYLIWNLTQKLYLMQRKIFCCYYVFIHMRSPHPFLTPSNLFKIFEGVVFIYSLWQLFYCWPQLLILRNN